MNLLRHTLPRAVRRINPNANVWVDDDLGRVPFNGWDREVTKAVMIAFARNLTDDIPEVALLRRVARQLDQSGTIQWEDPETNEEVALEQPYLNRINREQEREERLERAREKREKGRMTPILTEPELAALRDPGVQIQEYPERRLGG